MKAQKFYTDRLIFNVESKSTSEKEYYVTGYITTDDKDLVNDIVTTECMQDLERQLKSGNIKLDIEHEAFIEEGKQNTIPIGRILEAKLDDKGIWVKAVLNRDSPVFKTAWNSVKKRFLDAFSITFKPIKFINKMIDGVKVRLLEQMQLMNVALTGNPANPAASIDKVFMKSIMEDMKMSEPEKVDVPKEEAKVEEVKEEEVVEEKPTEEKPVEEVKPAEPEAEPVEQKSISQIKEELKSELSAEFKSKIEELEKKNEELVKKLEEPVLKSMVNKEMPKQEEPEKEIKSILSMCH